jgi:lipopolysaccharide/colanic/teichoic acid biosynthesis glycosyltransferase
MSSGKRCLDVVLAASALIVLLPVWLLVGVLVRLFLGAPVLYRQVRPGYLAQPFLLYKFRTMTGARDSQGQLLPDRERLTRLGRILRAWSLDELPELFNILRGDMSLVGPRPLLMEYLPLYSPEQARRHRVRPGLTGWAQINGRNAADWPTRLALDVWYVDNWSFGLDLRILLVTAWKVLSRQGVSQPGHATVENFKGER